MLVVLILKFRGTMAYMAELLIQKVSVVLNLPSSQGKETPPVSSLLLSWKLNRNPFSRVSKIQRYANLNRQAAFKWYMKGIFEMNVLWLNFWSVTQKAFCTKLWTQFHWKCMKLWCLPPVWPETGIRVLATKLILNGADPQAQSWKTN